MKTHHITQRVRMTARFVGILAILLSPLPVFGFPGGNGSLENPYHVETAEHLDAVRNDVAGHYVQTADIDLGVAPWIDGIGWVPIGGTVAGARFTGSYDGGGFAIQNLKIDRFAVASPTETIYVGLFRYLDGATVRNVNLENADVRGSTYTGALAGYANASLMDNVHAGGQVVGGGHTGGLAGQLGANCALNYVAFDGSVAGGDYTGGLIGSTVNGSTIRYAWTAGSVQGASSVGGLIGQFRTSASGTYCSLADAFSRASVAGVSNVGGAIGLQYYSNVSRAYSSGPVTGTGSNVGGFLGVQSTAATLRDCYWNTESSGLATSAGGTGVVGRTSSEMKQQSTFQNYNFFTAWQIDEGHDFPRFQDLALHAAPADLTLEDLVGEGTAASPYLIHNASELAAMRLNLAAHYRLQNDIDLAASVAWDAGLGWEPVGVSSAAAFAGTLDGAGFAIRNLTINRPPTSYQGLFGYLGAAKVRNLRIEDASVYGNSFTGTLAGHTAGSTVENVHANGAINGTSNTGGLAGQLASATDLNYVSYSGSVVGGDRTGGLVGCTVNGSTIRYVWTAGSVQGASSTGGLIGYFRTSASGTYCSLADAFSRASVAGVSNVGGAIGYQYYSNVSRTYSSGPVTGTGSNVGGFLGFQSTAATLRDCYWDIESSGRATSAGGTGVAGRTISEMKQQSTFQNYNFFTAWQIDEGHDFPRFQDLALHAAPAALTLDDLAGEGTAEWPYLIQDASELDAMRLGLAAHYRLQNDIDLTASVAWDAGRGWVPVGVSSAAAFAGTLDGAGFAIRNLTINRPPTSYQGLFGYLGAAKVHNLRIEDASVYGNSFTGTLAGHTAGSSVENVHANGEINGTSNTGGLAGQLASATDLNYVSYSGSVVGDNNTGGLVGSTFSGSRLRHVWTTGSVRGASSVGGLIGYFRTSQSGANCSLADAYSRASVAGVFNVGGAIGFQYYSDVSRTYSSGPVTGTGSNVGGFLGVQTTAATLRDCYWDTESSGRATSAGGTGVAGRTSNEMRKQSTFPNFNFFTTWRIDEGVDYPRLHVLGVNANPAAIVLTDLAGDGSAEFPYLITSADELHAMHQDLAAHYRLANDIDLAGSAFWDGGRGWLPVGASTATPFTGTMDGAGHTIRNLAINRPPTNDQGFFGCLGGAVVVNLNLENASVRGNTRVGALAGYANASSVRNVRAAGEVTGGEHTGGLIGWLGSSCELNHTSFSGWVHGGNNTGGLVGSTVSGSSIRYVWTEGSVRGASYVGGLIGSFRTVISGAYCSLADAFSLASVAGVSQVGGALGYQYYSNVSRVFSTGTVTGTGSNIGGFVGLAGIGSTLRDCYWDADSSGLESSSGGSGVTGLDATEMKQRESFPNFNFFTVWRIDEGIGYPRFREPGAQAEPVALTLDDLAGLGTEESPYLITTADELHAMRLDLAAHYLLENDIDLSASASWDAGRGWIPVGVSSASAFNGVLDGAGHTIRNLTINRPPTNYQGLFGYINGGEVRDLRMETASIRGNDYTATVAGYATAATFENVHASGDVSGGGHTGGLFGQLAITDLNYLSFAGSVVGTNNTGGLAGSTVSGTNIRHVWTEGSVQGAAYVGGLVGYFRTNISGTYCSLADAFNQASVAGVSHVGGAIGYQYYSNVSRVFSTGTVSGTGSNIGGFVGFAGTASTLRDCIWDMDASGQPASAGGSGVSGLDSTQMKQRASFLNFNFFTAWRMDEGVDHPRFRDLGAHAAPVAVALDALAGLGTEESPYLITTADELNAMRLNLAAHYRLGNDIDLSASVYWDAGRGWIPVGVSSASAFSGVLDGAGHTIRNLTINRPPTNYQGLFGYINGGEVRDLHVESASIRGNAYTAAFAGYAAAATFENVHASGDVTGGGHTGGLIGQMTTSGLNRAGFAGSVDGGDHTGGLIGSTVSGSVIHRVWTIGTVRGASSVGGLVGAFRTSLSGTNCSLADAYSRASVAGTSNVGGALGYQYYSSVSRTYSSGPVAATGSFVGGFLGRAFSGSSQALCHWDTESSGLATSGGGTGVVGRTSTQMRQQATFVNWDFAATWGIEESLAYPFHREMVAQIGLSPADRSHRDEASTGHIVEVVANAAWTAVTAETWITITGGSSGWDDGAVVYSLAANPLPVARHGVITVTAADGGSRDFHVYQEALLGISPALAAHDAPASSGHAVHVSGNVAWSAQASESWIQITSGASGADDGLLVYALTENFSLDPRVGTITISGGGVDRVVQIHQGGAVPYLGISPEWLEHPAEGAAGQMIAVTANTAWSAVSDSLWITLVGGSSGTGNGSVEYQVAVSDAHAPRVGHVTVSDGSRSLQHRVFQVPQGSVRIDIVDAPSGTGFFTGFGQYRAGERVTLDAWNSASHVFVSWSDGAGVVSPHPQFVFTAQEPRTLTANYELRVHTLAYLATEDGSIHGDPQQFVQHGSNGSPVLAVPNTGYFFTAWSDGVTTAERRDLDVTTSFEVTAEFARIPYTLAYTAGEGGGMVGETPQTVLYESNGEPVEAAPDAGAVFHQWSDGSTANPRTDENVQADIEVTAHFRSSGGVDIDWYAGHGIFPGEGQTWADLDAIDRFGKGMTLLDEFIATTDPNDPQSRFASDAPARAGTAMEIHFQPSSPDRRYTLWRSTDLADWTIVLGQERLPGGNGPMVDADPPDPSAFYRIEVGMP